MAIPGGPDLIVPKVDRPLGSLLVVTVGADEILLAVGPVSGLSARNVIQGVVARIVPHGTDAEVLVDVGSIRWIVSVVLGAVGALALQPGAPVRMIVKARSCRVADGPLD